MRKIQLFKAEDHVLELEPPLEHAPDCDRCPLGRSATSPCVRPAGKPGGVLLLSGAPPARTASTRPWSSGPERRLAETVTRMTGEPLSFDHAIRCPGSNDAAIEACRGYLVRSLEKIQPRLILVFGSTAARVLTGHSVPVRKLRRGWARLPSGAIAVFLPDPFVAAQNRVEAKWMREDIAWALAFKPPAELDACAMRVETLEDALACEEDLAGERLFFDTETYGQMHHPDFKVVALAMSRLGSTDSNWLWPEDSMVEGDPRREVLVRLLTRAPAVGGHNVKYDLNAVRCHFGIHLGFGEQQIVDTFVWAKLLRADGVADLDSVSHHVGLGGHKAEAHRVLASAKTVLSRLRVAVNKPVPVEWDVEERTTKDGKLQRRKKVTLARDPTASEKQAVLLEQWDKSRKVAGESVTFASLTGLTQPTPDWIHAACSGDGSPDRYVYGLASREVIERYCAQDTAAGSLLARLYEQQLTEDHWALLDSHLARAPAAVGLVESWGMGVSLGKASTLELELRRKAEGLLGEIWAHKEDLQPGSPQQLSAYLFGKKSTGGLGLKPLKTSGKTGAPSTDRMTLTKLKDSHPVIPLVLQWKEVDKLSGTYARGMVGHVAPDARIHCAFNIMGAETGRMSCTEPNMQTVPSRGQYAKLVKDLFIPRPGYLLVQMDYKTLEMRVAAMLSGDPVMIEIFLNGEDPHTRTAELVSEMVWGSDFATCGGLTGDELKAEQKRRRGVCKWVNFGTVYGQAAETLAEMAGISVTEAEKAQGIVMGRFTVLQRWIKDTIRSATQSGATWTWWAGRRARTRPVPDIGSEDKGFQGHGQRQAFNTPVQGTGHEFCLASAIAAVQWILDDMIDARLVMMVHDSLVFEVREDDAEELIGVVQSIMEGHQTAHGLPLEVDVEVGRSWGSLVAWDEWKQEAA